MHDISPIHSRYFRGYEIADNAKNFLAAIYKIRQQYLGMSCGLS